LEQYTALTIVVDFSGKPALLKACEYPSACLSGEVFQKENTSIYTYYRDIAVCQYRERKNIIFFWKCVS